jgi:hypothetical protein
MMRQQQQQQQQQQMGYPGGMMMGGMGGMPQYDYGMNAGYIPGVGGMYGQGFAAGGSSNSAAAAASSAAARDAAAFGHVVKRSLKDPFIAVQTTLAAPFKLQPHSK